MRKFKIWDDPYGLDFSICERKTVTIRPGVTVLVGCNGIGKTTLINNIKEELKKEVIPCIHYNNLADGGHTSIESLMFNGHMKMAATLMSSSEGENIDTNISILLSKVKHFIQTGQYTKDESFERIKAIFTDDDKSNDSKLPDERWILLDAVDSGYSIDNIVELKEVFDLIIGDAHNAGVEIYIVVAANSYEMACGENCMDICTGKYVTFNDYDDYKKFILHTKDIKDKRFE